MEECEQCKGSGVAPGKAPITCTTCGGRGQMRYQQGFFSVSAHLQHLRRHRAS